MNFAQMLDLWRDTIILSFKDLWFGFASVLPKILAAFIIFIVGWIIAAIIGKVVAKLIRSIKVDNALRGTEVERAVNRAGFTLDIARFIGGLCEWFVIVVAFVAAFNILGLEAVNLFLANLLAYVPNVVIAVVILVAAAIIGEVLQKVVRGSAAAAGMKASVLAGSVTKWAIWIFAIMSALSQISVLASFIDSIFLGVTIAFSIAFGLAFGLGGQHAASEIIANVRKDIETK